MHIDPLTLRADLTVGEAVRTIQKHRFRSMPVVEDDGTMVGQFGVHNLLALIVPKVTTMRGGLHRIGFMHDDMDDLRRRVADEWDEPVREHAHTEVSVVAPDASLTQCVLALYSKQENLPVVDDDGKLVGVLSYWDVIDHLVEGPGE